MSEKIAKPYNTLWTTSLSLLQEQEVIYGSVFQRTPPGWLKKFLGQPAPETYHLRDLPQPAVIGTERDQCLAILNIHGLSRSRKLAVDLPYADGTCSGALHLTGFWEAELQDGIPRETTTDAQLLQLQVLTSRSPTGSPGPLQPAEEFLFADDGLDHTCIYNMEQVAVNGRTNPERALGFLMLLGDNPRDL